MIINKNEIEYFELEDEKKQFEGGITDLNSVI